MRELIVKNLHVRVEDREILHGVDITVQAGETVAIMGPNGNGKSTLLKVIMGHPRYEITKGDVLVDGKSIKDLPPNERAKLGLFFGMQNPQEIPGVLIVDFLRSALNAKTNNKTDLFAFFKSMENGVKKLHMADDVTRRFVNEGFSGGEKKKNEILQLMVIDPQFAMLDEIDSGLDVDALALVSSQLNEFVKQPGKALIIVSHYERLFKLIKPTKAYVLVGGKVVMSGGEELVNKIDQEGYEWVKKQTGAKIVKRQLKKSSIAGDG